jgi:hypothetical protein
MYLVRLRKVAAIALIGAVLVGGALSGCSKQEEEEKPYTGMHPGEKPPGKAGVANMGGSDKGAAGKNAPTASPQ